MNRPEAGAGAAANKVYHLYPNIKSRIIAVLIDFLLLLTLIVLSCVNSATFKARILLDVIVVLILIHRPVMEYFFGATLGEIFCGMHIISLDNKKPALLAIGIRYILFLPLFAAISISLKSIFDTLLTHEFSGISGFIRLAISPEYNHFHWIYLLFLLIIICDYLIIWFNPKQQAWHDILSKTYCVFHAGHNRNRLFKTSRGIEFVKAALLLAVLISIGFIYIRFKPLDRLRPVVENLAARNDVDKKPENKLHKPIKAAVIPNECVVKGIFVIKQDSSVLIDSKSYKLGDVVCGGMIVGITHERVTFRFNKYGDIQFGVGSKIKTELQ